MKYLKVFTDFLEVAEGLSDGALARLFRAMLRYALDGTEPQMKSSERALWTVARQNIDRETAAYESKVKHLQRGRSSVSKTTRSVSEEDKDKEKEKDKDKDKDNDSLSSTEPRLTAEEREKKPSLEEVMSFSQEAGLNVDVQYFYNYYEANGWYIGKRPIRDWKAALKAWARKTPPPRPAPTRQKSTRETFLELMERARIEEAKEV
jgi:hypothetical protein